MRENKSQRQGKSWQGEKRERNREKEKGGRKTEMMVRKRQRGRETEAVRIRVGGEPPPGPAPRPPALPHRPSVGLSSLPHQPHSWLCRHSWQVRKRSQLRHRGSECTLQGDGCGAVRATPTLVSAHPSWNPATRTAPVVPASAAPVRVYREFWAEGA